VRILKALALLLFAFLFSLLGFVVWQQNAIYSAIGAAILAALALGAILASAKAVLIAER
jgi:hypothetical protein